MLLRGPTGASKSTGSSQTATAAARPRFTPCVQRSHPPHTTHAAPHRPASRGMATPHTRPPGCTANVHPCVERACEFSRMPGAPRGPSALILITVGRRRPEPGPQVEGPGNNGCTAWGCRQSYHYNNRSKFHMVSPPTRQLTPTCFCFCRALSKLSPVLSLQLFALLSKLLFFSSSSSFRLFPADRLRRGRDVDDDTRRAGHQPRRPEPSPAGL